MKSRDLRRLAVICIAAFVCILQFGCQEQAAQSPAVTELPVETPAAEAEAPPAAEPETPAAEAEAPPAVGQGPKIKFENVVCDLGNIGPGTRNICDFKFTNVGDSLLKITNVSKTCACTPFDLEKKEYAPGESGLLQVSYNASNRGGPITKHLQVSCNDQTNPQIQLTVKGRIIEIVSYEPKKLELILNKENAACPDIILKSQNGQPFSIKGLKTTGRFQSSEDCITADYDPNASATEFVLHPKVDLTKLRRGTSGMVAITVACPGDYVISIPFKILQRFKIEPPSITVFDAKAGKSETREVWIVNNYNEVFEIESTSSERGAMKVISQETKDNHCKLELEITPPTVEGAEKVFTDVLFVNIKDGEKLQISCHGYFAKEASGSSQ